MAGATVIVWAVLMLNALQHWYLLMLIAGRGKRGKMVFAEAAVCFTPQRRRAAVLRVVLQLN
jgi:DNA polymerase III delta subunit